MGRKPMGLKDIEFAHNGEQTETNYPELTPSFEEPSRVTHPENELVIFKLVDNNKKGGVFIPHIDDVLNPETKREERMRLLVGVNSIWMKDQKDLDANYVRQNARSLHFPRGKKIMAIRKTDTAALEFARLTRHNVKGVNGWQGSKFGFYEYDAAAEAKAALDRELLELDMAIAVRELDEANVIKYMQFLKLPIYDQITGQVKESGLLRRELMLYAKRRPDAFKSLIQERSKEVETTHLVNKLIVDAKIDIASQPGRAFWANGGGLIGVIPNGRRPNEYLAELAMTNSEEGRTFNKQLQENSK